MPDVWTTNPEKLRSVLTKLGADCGKEPRVLKPRDAEWTCHADFPEIRYDLYIHSALEGSSPLLTELILIATIATITGIFTGLLWGRRFWRGSRSQRK